MVCNDLILTYLSEIFKIFENFVVKRYLRARIMKSHTFKASLMIFSWFNWFKCVL